uniref:Uncharacterized protein MANES_05G032500 n=1 Tax=Rhizophora mucronata TaxID=61149 RepID=A0A2P2IXM2_RHIMU
MAKLRLPGRHVAAGNEHHRGQKADVLAEPVQPVARFIQFEAESEGLQRVRARVQRKFGVLEDGELDRQVIHQCTGNDSSVHLWLPLCRSLYLLGVVLVHGKGAGRLVEAAADANSTGCQRAVETIYLVAADGELEHVLVAAGQSLQSLWLVR